jgi:hypothetical protein
MSLQVCRYHDPRVGALAVKLQGINVPRFGESHFESELALA